MEQISKTNLLYPELSYQIIGSAFKVLNKLGLGHKEIYYARALAEEFESGNISFEKEKTFHLLYNDKIIGDYRPDFLVDNKIIIELKVRPRIGYVHIKQLLAYLKMTELKLAIIIYFTQDGVKYRRIVNSV